MLFCYYSTLNLTHITLKSVSHSNVTGCQQFKSSALGAANLRNRKTTKLIVELQILLVAMKPIFASVILYFWWLRSFWNILFHLTYKNDNFQELVEYLLKISGTHCLIKKKYEAYIQAYIFIRPIVYLS